MIVTELDDFCSAVRREPSKRSYDNFPWTNGKEYSHEDTYIAMHAEILDFAKWIHPTDLEHQIRLLIVERFRNAIKALWPESQVVVYGSTCTKTYLPGGDIDFTIYNTPDLEDEELLELVHSHLKSMQVVSRSEIIHARFPIIKAIEKPYGYRIDVSVNNIAGVLNVERNLSYFSTYPALYPVLMVLKMFLFQRHLDEPYKGGIGSNTLIQMIIFVIQSLDKRKDQRNMGFILMQFFRIFGSSFNFITTGITTRDGGRAFSKKTEGRLNWKTPICLCFEDPQSPGIFLGENAYATYDFHKECERALDDINNPRWNSPSFLNRFMSKPIWIIKHRKELIQRFMSSDEDKVEGFSIEITSKNKKKPFRK